MAQIVGKNQTSLALTLCGNCKSNILYSPADIFDHHRFDGGVKEIDPAIQCPCCGQVVYV